MARKNQKGKSAWVLSEKTLSLPEKDWKKFLERSKATPKSKARYKTERRRYKTLQKKCVTYGKERFSFETKRYRQKEAHFGREVWFATSKKVITVTKTNFTAAAAQLKRIFYASMHYRLNAKFAGFKIRYNVIMHRKRSSVDEYLGSTIQYADEYAYAVDNLLYKIRHLVFSASVNGIVVTREITKFYAGAQK